MAEITVLQLMDMIEQDKSIRNYQSRWRELRSLLEKQARVASQQSVRRADCLVCRGRGFNVDWNKNHVQCSTCNGTGISR